MTPFIPPRQDRCLEEILATQGNHLTMRERIVRALHELGGEATAREIANHLSGRYGPTTNEVGNTLATRDDVVGERPRQGGAYTYRFAAEVDA